MTERMRKRAFATHVVAFVLAVPALGGGLVGSSTVAVAVAGVLLCVSGVMAMTAGRSMTVPVALRGQADRAPDPAERARVEHAGAVMSGIVLTALGLVIAVLGLAALA